MKIIMDSSGRKNKQVKSNLTFTITTCKRFDLFKQTMDMFILNCKDVYIIDKWLCVDDNSSDEDRKKMQSLYPFFTFILKGLKNKGHQRSMNIILDNIKTDYALQFEDDWICKESFYIYDYLKMIKDKKFDHLILRWIGGKHKHYKKVRNFDIYTYMYNPGHYIKPKENKEYDVKKGYITSIKNMDTKDHWWWPGFTLNPGIYNIKLVKKHIGKYNEKIPTELFEYDYALRCYKYGYKVGIMNINIHHTGKISSYSLNDTHRYYDKNLI